MATTRARILTQGSPRLECIPVGSGQDWIVSFYFSPLRQLPCTIVPVVDSWELAQRAEWDGYTLNEVYVAEGTNISRLKTLPLEEMVHLYTKKKRDILVLTPQAQALVEASA